MSFETIKDCQITSSISGLPRLLVPVGIPPLVSVAGFLFDHSLLAFLDNQRSRLEQPSEDTQIREPDIEQATINL